MASDHSFDIACKVDPQEVDNAVNQALKEIVNRYDLKDSKSEIDFNKTENKLSLTSSDNYKIKAVLEILKQKLIKRDISPRALEEKEIQKASGDTAKQDIIIQQGIPVEKAKDMIKDIKATKMKVQCQIQDDQIRVTAKKIDDLQAVMQLIRSKDYGIHTQFSNMR
jgi:cyclic-di-GMP-binding protein